VLGNGRHHFAIAKPYWQPQRTRAPRFRRAFLRLVGRRDFSTSATLRCSSHSCSYRIGACAGQKWEIIARHSIHRLFACRHNGSSSRTLDRWSDQPKCSGAARSSSWLEQGNPSQGPAPAGTSSLRTLSRGRGEEYSAQRPCSLRGSASAFSANIDSLSGFLVQCDKSPPLTRCGTMI
jgi:hypothetical protein